MTFWDNGNDEVYAEYTIPSDYEGYPGVVHGGVQAAILDEIVGRVSLVENFHHFMMSVRLDVKYRLSVPVNEPLRFLGRRITLCGRRGRAEGHIYLADGRLATEASVTLVRVSEELITPKVDRLEWRVDA